jgi:hypothetical protein
MNPIKSPNYIIQAIWQNGKNIFHGYIQIDPIKIISNKQEATLFSSKILATGWMMKVQSIYPTYKISLIIL